MRYDALGIGEKELSRGLAEVDKLIEQNGLLAINANVIDTETGELHYQPYTIIEAGNIKVGVTSILGGDAVVARTIKDREGVDLTDPIAAALEMLQILEKKSDVQVLIAHTGLQKGELLAEELGGYDVMLIGHGGRSIPEPKKENGVILASPGSRSNMLGELTLVVEDGQIISFEGKSWQLQQDDGPLDEVVKGLAWGHLELDENGVRIKKDKKKDLSQQVDQDQKPGAAANRDRQKTETVAQSADRYLGTQTCLICHADINESYEETVHSQAFQVIAESEQDWENPDCWNCHVLAWGEPSGHSTTELQPDLWNVQCESCHGMGTDHIRGAGRSRVNQATCTSSCHVVEHSPDFDYDGYLEEVVHTSDRSWIN